MNIHILTSGTRGDVQPLLALGQGLHDAGYAVCIVTHPAFQQLVEEARLSFRPLDGDPNELLQAATVAGAFSIGRQPLRRLRLLVDYLRTARPLFARMLESAWRECHNADTLIVTLPTTWGALIAQAAQIPCACAMFQPITPTNAFPTPFQPFETPFGPCYNRLSHHVVLRSLWLPWRPILARWNHSILQNRSVLPASPLDVLGKAPWLYGFSPLLVPPPPDWPDSHHIVGAWHARMPSSWQPPLMLEAFLAAGSAPVYVGFGSMTRIDRRTLGAVLAAADALRLRVLVATGEPTPRMLAQNALGIGALPHEWLFPQVAAVIHHGGAGTTASAFNAGVPQIIAPIAVDQHFWGQRVIQAGVGVRAPHWSQLTANKLIAAIQHTLTPTMRARAAELGILARQENGIAQAVALLQGAF